jgi:hypothetical protein
MPTYTVRVELKGSEIESDEYRKLHDLMDAEGFHRAVYPSAKAFPKAALLMSPMPKRHAMPHATYMGDSRRTTDPLLNDLVARIKAEVQPDIVVLVAETVSRAIYP